MINSGFSEAFGDVYEGKFPDTGLSGPQRQALWSLINALQYTWTLAKDGLLHPFYSRHQAVSWFYGLKPKRQFFLQFMDDNYVDPAFRNLVATITSATDIEDAKRVFNGILRNRRDRNYF